MTARGTSADSEIPPLRRDRRVQVWVGAVALSSVGDVAWYIGLAWTAAQVAGPVAAGLVMGIGTVPKALFLLVGGAVADRWDARRTMVATHAGRVVVLLTGVAVAETSVVSLPLLVVVALLFGALDALHDPASGTMPRQLVRPDDLAATAAMFQLGGRVATLVGAPLGGLVVATGGLTAVMLLDAATFAVIAVVLVVVVHPRFPLERSTGTGVLADLRAGLGYLRRTANVRVLVLAISGLNLFVGPVLAVGLVLRTDEDGWGAGSLGLFQAAVGAGAAVGAIVAVRWRPRRPARVGLLMLVGQAAACAAVGVVPYAGVLAAMLTIGVTAGLASALVSGAFQRAVDGPYLGRMYSIVALGDNVLMPVAMTGFGALAAGASVEVACAITGALFAALVLWSASKPGLDGEVDASLTPAAADAGPR